MFGADIYFFYLQKTNCLIDNFGYNFSPNNGLLLIVFATN